MDWAQEQTQPRRRSAAGHRRPRTVQAAAVWRLVDGIASELGPSPRQGAPAIFLDRDGTLIADPGYLRDPALVRLLPGVSEGLRRLASAGYALVLISNQSGVGRGLITPDELEAVHRRTWALLEAEGLPLSGAWYCTHRPELRCACRKPAPGLLRAAAAALSLPLERSWMIGDRPSDVDAAQAAGSRAVLLDAETPDLVAASRLILDVRP